MSQTSAYFMQFSSLDITLRVACCAAGPNWQGHSDRCGETSDFTGSTERPIKPVTLIRGRGGQRTDQCHCNELAKLSRRLHGPGRAIRDTTGVITT